MDELIRAIEEDNLAQNAHEVGTYLFSGLQDLQKKYPAIGDVRGKGLMIGVEFVGEAKAPDAGLVGRLFEETKKEGLLIGKGGIYGNVVRIAPPLNVSKSQVDDFLRIFDESLGRC